jgi:hypothetical protein
MSQEHEEEGEGSNGHHRPSASPIAASRKSEDGLREHESPEFTRDFKRLYHLRHRLQKLMYEKEQVKYGTRVVVWREVLTALLC